MVRGAIVESQNIFARIVLRYLDRKFNSGLGDSCWLLHGLVRALKPATVVEIGSARGKSACYMALALRENGRGMLHAIDPHTSTDWNDTKAVDSYTWMTRTIRTLGLGRWITVVGNLGRWCYIYLFPAPDRRPLCEVGEIRCRLDQRTHSPPRSALAERGNRERAPRTGLRGWAWAVVEVLAPFKGRRDAESSRLRAAGWEM